jgi:hypothetical protein
MFMSHWCALITPQNATLDSKRTLSLFVSYRRLSTQFQFSLSPAALDRYLYGAQPATNQARLHGVPDQTSMYIGQWF